MRDYFEKPNIIKKIKHNTALNIEKILNWLERLEDDSLDFDKKKSILIKIYFWLIGIIYHFYKKIEEQLRVLFFNLFNSLANGRILYETLYHSRSLLLTILILFISSLGSFLINKTVVNLNDPKLFVDMLTAYFGASTAILGIIFALYSVGFQSTTERFSTVVTDYLNKEKVGQFFFKLLTFTSVFTLFNLLLQKGTTVPLAFTFVISTFLIITSLTGILVFKDDYMTKLKPKYVFERIYWQNMDAIRLVNSYNNPLLRNYKVVKQSNIKSFHLYLPILKSWSIVTTLRKQIDERLEVLENFYKDLNREKRIEDSTYGLVSLGYFISEYMSIKPYIDTDFGWWFPTYQEVVTTESFEMFPIKANYEAMGVGRLGIDKKNYDWLENRIINFLKDIQESTDFFKKPQIGNALISCYEKILSGSYTKTDLGYEKTHRGIFESQQFLLVDKTIELFLDLGVKLAKVDKCNSNFVNSIGQVKTTFIDGFSKRAFPGRLTYWEDDFKSHLEKIIKNKHLHITSNELISWKLPLYEYSLTKDLIDKLEVEELVEGHLVTPKRWAITQIMNQTKIKEDEILFKYSQKITKLLLTLTKLSDGQFYKDYLGGVILGMFNQLIYQDKQQVLESLLKEFSNELFVYITQIKQEVFIEQELRDPIDLGIFTSVVSRNKTIYSFYLDLFILTQLRLSLKKEETSVESTLMKIRRPLMLGGLTYLVSELDQDFSFVTKLTEKLEIIYPQVPLSTIFESSEKVKISSGFSTSFRVGLDEDNRYFKYFRQVLDEVLNLPRENITSKDTLYGIHFDQRIKHKSRFIQKMTNYALSDKDQSIEGYIEWLKKRELLRKIIVIMNYKINQHV